jgi:capsular exopolysaccharide synthesis family protein
MSKITEALTKCDQNAIDPMIASLLENEAEPFVTLPAATSGDAVAVPEPCAQEGGAAVSAPFATPAASTQTAGLRQPEAGALTVARTCALRLRANTPLMPFSESDWAAGEQYRMARTRIVQHFRKPRLMVISSPTVGDGKTVTAINLAGALSLKSEGKVLLADGDFRHSTVHGLLGLPEGPGLADVLRGVCALEDALIQVSQCPNLYILSAGTADANPAELLDSTRWSQVAAALRNTFQYAIIDSPPIGAVTDYDLIQAACDGVVLVLRPEHTKRAQVSKALDSIPKEKLIGVMLNDVRDWFFNKHQSSPYYLPLLANGKTVSMKSVSRVAKGN